MNERSMEFFEYNREPKTGVIRPIEVQMYFREGEPFISSSFSQALDINFLLIERDRLEIFDQVKYSDENLKALLHKLDKLEIIYKVKSGSLKVHPTMDPQYAFTIKQVFSFASRHHLTLTL
jgi:hypothetical protein